MAAGRTPGELAGAFGAVLVSAGSKNNKQRIDDPFIIIYYLSVIIAQPAFRCISIVSDDGT